MQSDGFWEARYEDGSFLRQYNEDGTTNKYTDIDRTRLKTFVYYLGGEPKLMLSLGKGKRLVYRARRSVSVATGKPLGTVHIIGYQETVGGENRQVLCFLSENGIVEVRDGFSEEHAIYNEVMFLPEEK